MRFSRNTLIGLAIVVAAVAAFGVFWLQAPTAPALQVEAVWSRPALMAKMEHQAETTSTQTTDDKTTGMAMEMGSRGVVYLTLLNKGRTSERLIGVQTDVAEHAELHQTIMEEGGLMKMRPVEGGIAIPAGGQTALEPGSYHIMLMNLKQDLKVGDRFALVLTFEQSQPLTVESEVVER